MTTSAERIRAWRGPALLSFGFRPLFLGAGLWAIVAMGLWIGALSGAIGLPTAFGLVDWHVHALLYGYVPAVAAGFLLTAVPNWTGRLPITGAPLGALAALWLAGRAAVLFSAHLPPLAAALADLAFLAALVAMIAREIVAGGNWRNLPVLGLVTLLLAGNALFHAEAAGGGYAAGGYGARLGMGAIVFLILLIGGRVTPSFTRNWLARRGDGRLPTPMNRFDGACLAVAAAALGAWIAAPERPVAGALCLAAGALHFWRLGRWAGERTLAEPLVASLHLGYAFAALGFLTVGGSTLFPDAIPRTGALHAWMAGAVGVMTLAVMTRASLGHSGRALTASPAITAAYALVALAALARIAAGFAPGAPGLLHVAGAAWIAGFGVFVWRFAPLLALPRAPKDAR